MIKKISLLTLLVVSTVAKPHPFDDMRITKADVTPKAAEFMASGFTTAFVSVCAKCLLDNDRNKVALATLDSIWLGQLVAAVSRDLQRKPKYDHRMYDTTGLLIGSALGAIMPYMPKTGLEIGAGLGGVSAFTGGAVVGSVAKLGNSNISILDVANGFGIVGMGTGAVLGGLAGTALATGTFYVAAKETKRNWD